MASRNTKAEAQDLRNEIEARFPGVDIRIVDKSAVRKVGRKIAERQGLEILKDDGRFMVKVFEPKFEVLEVRTCRCGAEVLTAAIGEDSLDECPACRAARKERQERDLETRIARKAADRERFERWDI